MLKAKTRSFFQSDISEARARKRHALGKMGEACLFPSEREDCDEQNTNGNIRLESQTVYGCSGRVMGPHLWTLQTKGNFVTFTPPKDAAYLIGDFTDWDEVFLSIDGPLTIEIPRGAYVEYAYLDTDKRPVIDATNPEKPKNPWYSYHSSITLPQNQFQTPPRPQSFRGTVREYFIDSKSFGQHWTYYVYEPPVSPIATLYVHDGAAFSHKLHFHEVTTPHA